MYGSEEISRMMPGKKDFVSVKINGTREHVQKQLMLCNLCEAFTLLKQRYGTLKVGFSKFCELRPKHCVLAGASGTHSVCVCTTHQRAKLMTMQCRLKELFEGDRPIKSYKDVIMYVVCDSPTEACYFGDYKNSPGFEEVKRRFEEVKRRFEETFELASHTDNGYK